MILGGQGAGKTTLALRLGKICSLPIIHIDKYYHHPAWKTRPQAEAFAELEACANTERWIMDGDDFRSFGPRLKRADTIVYLHVSTLRRVARVIKRTYQSFGKPRVDLPDGCTGRVTFESIKWALYGYPMIMRPAMLNEIRKRSVQLPMIHLRSEADIQKLEAQLAKNE